MLKYATKHMLKYVPKLKGKRTKIWKIELMRQILIKIEPVIETEIEVLNT